MSRGAEHRRSAPMAHSPVGATGWILAKFANGRIRSRKAIVLRTSDSAWMRILWPCNYMKSAAICAPLLIAFASSG